MKLFKNYFLIALWALSLSLFLSSCGGDDEKPAGEFSSGVFVVNEGSFGKSDGTVTHYNSSTGEVKQDIYGQKNNGLALGDIVQSLSFFDEEAYIVVNNDNKVEVAEDDTFEAEHTLRGVSLPRYFTTFNGKGYLTEWVNFTDKGRVAVVNLDTHTVETTIATDYGSENIIAASGKLFVSNNFTNTVSVINPSTNTVTTTLNVGSSPGEFVIDSENKLWVICGGDYNMNNGALYRINAVTNTVEKSIPLVINTSGRLAINQAKNQVYYIKGKNVYKVGIQETTAPAAAFITVTAAVGAYGIGVDPATDIIYVADAKGFVANGSVFRYKNDGTFIDEFAAGKGPNGFVFR